MSNACYVQPMTSNQVNDAFLAATPYISETIINMEQKFASFYADLPKMEVWPYGVGTQMQQIIARSSLPQLESGFSSWRQYSNNTGCDPCDGPDCAYQWKDVGGTAFDRKMTSLMTQDYRSNPYCVKQIQSTYEYNKVMGIIVRNLYTQMRFEKEYNIVFNALTSLAKKFVVDSGGPKPNTANPYAYPNIGDKKIAMLNTYLVEDFYEYMVRLTQAIPYNVTDGNPIFALHASKQVLREMYLQDSNLRQDLRFSGLADSLVTKYNFTSTIGGMFLPVPCLWPRRFKIVDGEAIQVSPFLHNIAAEVGFYSDVNPDYLNPSVATHEEVIMHGQQPFGIMYQPTAQTVGDGTSFGPEPGFLDQWQWSNPQTDQDPARRVGRFFTTATIAITQDFSDAIYSVLVPRRPVALSAQFFPAASCPPADPACDNEIPATGCPCAEVVTVYADPFTAGQYVVQFAVADTGLDVGETLNLALATGGYITFTVASKSPDDFFASGTFANGWTPPSCDVFTTIYCPTPGLCSGTVESVTLNYSDPTRISVALSNLLSVTSGTVTAYFADGSSASVTLVSADTATRTYVVDLGSTAYCADPAITSICVPTATDANCPACSGGMTQCS